MAVRALILGSDPQKVLAVVAALGEAGAQAIVGVGAPAMAAAARSRLRPTIVALPPLSEPVALRDCLLKYLRHGTVNVVLPIEDGPLVALAPWRRELEILTPWASPPEECTAVALDKERTIAAAAELEGALRPPATIVPGGGAEMPTAWRGPYPVVVKPRTGTGAEGVCCADDAAELTSVYHAIDARYPRPLVQELIPYRRGEKYLLFYLFDADGALRSWYMHRVWVERHTMRRGINGGRLPGGINLVWESCFDEPMLTRGQRLLEALGWRGYGFIECVRDSRTGEPRLIEINPRLAGTIALPLQQGVNFAHDSCLVALGLRPPLRLSYESGARGKRDALSLLGAREPRAMAAVLDPRYAAPISFWRDPGPLLCEAARLLGKRLHRTKEATAASGRPG